MTSPYSFDSFWTRTNKLALNFESVGSYKYRLEPLALLHESNSASWPYVVPVRVRLAVYSVSCLVVPSHEVMNNNNTRATKQTCNSFTLWLQRPTCRKPYYAHFDTNVALSQYISVALLGDFSMSLLKRLLNSVFTY